MKSRYSDSQALLASSSLASETSQNFPATSLKWHPTHFYSRWEAHAPTTAEQVQDDPDWDIDNHPLGRDPMFQQLSRYLRDPSPPRATLVPPASTAAQQAAVGASNLQLAANWWRANES